MELQPFEIEIKPFLYVCKDGDIALNKIRELKLEDEMMAVMERTFGKAINIALESETGVIFTEGSIYIFAMKLSLEEVENPFQVNYLRMPTIVSNLEKINLLSEVMIESYPDLTPEFFTNFVLNFIGKPLR